jgi:hypothetical protein
VIERLRLQGGVGNKGTYDIFRQVVKEFTTQHGLACADLTADFNHTLIIGKGDKEDIARFTPAQGGIVKSGIRREVEGVFIQTEVL